MLASLIAGQQPRHPHVPPPGRARHGFSPPTLRSARAANNIVRPCVRIISEIFVPVSQNLAADWIAAAERAWQQQIAGRGRLCWGYVNFWRRPFPIRMRVHFPPIFPVDRARGGFAVWFLRRGPCAGHGHTPDDSAGIVRVGSPARSSAGRGRDALLSGRPAILSRGAARGWLRHRIHTGRRPLHARWR